jgi:hypothetical protein
MLAAVRSHLARLSKDQVLSALGSRFTSPPDQKVGRSARLVVRLTRPLVEMNLRLKTFAVLQRGRSSAALIMPGRALVLLFGAEHGLNFPIVPVVP